MSDKKAREVVSAIRQHYAARLDEIEKSIVSYAREGNHDVIAGYVKTRENLLFLDSALGRLPLSLVENVLKAE